MMLPVSALSVTARNMRGLIAQYVGLPEDQILIGHPMEATTTGGADTTGKQYLNLFFYRVVHSGYPSDGIDEDPFYVRLHCLITALGANETLNSNVITAGENDLRLIGSIMQIMHQNPVIAIHDENNQEIASLQIVPINLSLDDINHIWSTQGDTPYRLSIGYEMGLLPLPMAERIEKAQRAGAVGVDTGASQEQRKRPFSGDAAASDVASIRVDTEDENWTPHICFVREISGQYTCSYSLSFEARSKELKAFRPLIWVAGKPGEKVYLYWERWLTAKQGWHDYTNKRHIRMKRNVTISGREINPENAGVQPPGTFAKIFRPFYWGKSSSSQGVLYAVRTYKRASDGVKIEVRSNPLLLIAYKKGRV